MDVMTLVLTALVSGGAVSYLFELLQKGSVKLDGMSVMAKRLVTMGIVVVVVLLQTWMKTTSLPVDLSAWTPDMVQTVVMFLATQAWHLFRKKMETPTA